MFDVDKTVCHSATIINRFGTWNTAIEKSGLVIERKNKKRRTNTGREERKNKKSGKRIYK